MGFVCPQCGWQLEADKEMRDHRMRCPVCTRTISVHSAISPPPPIGQERQGHVGGGKTVSRYWKHVAGLILTVMGCAALTAPFIGFLLGTPLLCCGFGLCAAIILSTSNRDFPAWQRTAGAVMALCGLCALYLSCCAATEFASQFSRMLRYHHDIWDPRYALWPKLPGCSFLTIAPAFISLGMWLRADLRLRFFLGWAAYWFIYGAAVAATVFLLFLLGGPGGA